MKRAIWVAGVLGALATAGASAADGVDLAKAKGCLNCHAVDTKKVGPAFKDVAAKHQGDGASLLAKLKSGKGHPKVSAGDDDLQTILGWVLSRK